MRLLLFVILAAGVAAAMPRAFGGDAPGPNDACLGCHGDASAKAQSGKSVAVDAKGFAASVHGSLNLPCTGCHTGISADKFPHDPQKPVECAGCHAKAVQEYSATIHGKARAQGSAVAATCANCHGAHDIRRAGDPASRVHRANLEATCGACHGNAAVIRDAKLPGGNVVASYHDSIHGRAINRGTSAKEAVPTCTTCHGAHDMRPKSDPDSRVARASIPDTCGGCHMNVKATWQKSHHGKLRQVAVLQAPGCTDCHSAHAILQHDLEQWKLAAIGACGTCHAERLDTYRDTFHGQVTQLGDARIATCATCHGAHEVLPASDPLSRVSAQNRLATCRTCHAKANASFAQYDPHPNRHKREAGQLLYYTGKFMDLLLLGVFAFFGVHTLLWFYRSLAVVRERRARERAGAPPENR
jgi:nitrate/TMAO reductase-like tetraheme cytochrome c subunit